MHSAVTSATDAVPVAVQGLSWGGAGTWTAVAMLVGYYFKTRADKKRADNEGVTVEAAAAAAASKAQFERLNTEIERLNKRAEQQDLRIDAQMQRIDELETQLRDCEQRHNQVEAELLRLRAVNSAQGEIRAQAATIVAAERLTGGA